MKTSIETSLETSLETSINSLVKSAHRYSIASIIFAIIAVVFAVLAVVSSARAGDCYSEGVRVGSLQKFSQKGLLIKSWEGEMVMEGTKINGNSAGVRGGNVWAFSVLDPVVAKVIDGAMMTGGQVALRYCQTLIPLMQTNTGYRITQAVERKQ